MPYDCCVPGCRSNYNLKQSVTIFSFPKDSARAQTWLIHTSDYLNVKWDQLKLSYDAILTLVYPPHM